MIDPEYFVPAPDEHVRKERAKARELRRSQWWRNLRGKGVCYYCKGHFTPQELSMDHLVPVIRGGKSTKANIVPACKPCNDDKKYLLPVEWQGLKDAPDPGDDAP